MTIRTTSTTLQFDAPFRVAGLNLPAGKYHLETDEEVIETASRTVYRRVATTLRVQTGARIEHHPVDPVELAVALERDREARMATTEAMPSSMVNPHELSTDPAALSPDGVAGTSPWRSIPMWMRTARADRRDPEGQ
ncbi:hypothetical protein [Sphingomonas sp. KC8]|uniref:hypothetical protein n=1 Tax=Sphingomonas sp. KC8 TaxID=1030157 RepID=UPI000248AB8C|nr:hypothetical protein [Sphingomonas sp. KC8]